MVKRRNGGFSATRQSTITLFQEGNLASRFVKYVNALKGEGFLSKLDSTARVQNRGNSGILLQGLYEIQVLDGFENPAYADGQTGAIYRQWPPLANPTLKPGKWQSYGIVFEAPRMDGAILMKPADVTVLLNSVRMHHLKELMGPTIHRELSKYAAQPAKDSLVLQDYQQPVRYRNLWIRRAGACDK